MGAGRGPCRSLAAVGRLWGGEAIKRFHFDSAGAESSIFASLLGVTDDEM